LHHGDNGSVQAGPREVINIAADPQFMVNDITPDGRWFAVSYRDKNYISLVSTDPRQLSRVDLRGVPNGSQVALSPDGAWAACAIQATGGAQVWDLRTAQPACDLDKGENTFVTFSHDSQWLLTATPRGYQFWRAGSWQKGPVIAPENGGRLQGYAAVFSPTGNILAVQQTADRIALFDARDATPLATLEPPRPLLLDQLRFTGDGTKLAAVGANQVIHLWDLLAIRRELRARDLDWE
jgi:WD40 repeat protein